MKNEKQYAWAKIPRTLDTITLSLERLKHLAVGSVELRDLPNKFPCSWNFYLVNLWNSLSLGCEILKSEIDF